MMRMTLGPRDGREEGLDGNGFLLVAERGSVLAVSYSLFLRKCEAAADMLGRTICLYGS